MGLTDEILKRYTFVFCEWVIVAVFLKHLLEILTKVSVRKKIESNDWMGF